MERPEDQARRALCARNFRKFLPYWSFRNRESGAIATFAELWDGQRAFVDAISQHNWIFALKAGKLGFTELECAYDAWVALFRHPNARVHLFSKDDRASRELLKYVRFGLEHLPPWMGVDFTTGAAGGLTSQSLMFRASWMGPDDVRTITSYPATGSVAIDVSASHSHIDELSHMQDGEAVWNSVATTVAPEGTCHVVTRGAGDVPYSYKLWNNAVNSPPAMQGSHMVLFPFFAPASARPYHPSRDRTLLIETGAMTHLGLMYFLPETPEDAFMGDDESPYIPLEIWDRCKEPNLQGLEAGDKTALIIGVDAAVTGDCFGVVVAARHGDRERHNEVVLRASRKWSPADFPDRRIDFSVPEDWLRLVISGGCPVGHPRSRPSTGANRRSGDADCEFCLREEFPIERFNVVQVCYDPYQLEDMMQRLRKEGICWFEAFDQGSERLIGDSMMYTMAMQGKLHHNGDPDLREHIGNAKAKLQPDQESTMRIVKKSNDRKIDLAVAASMAVLRCTQLNI